MSTDWNLIREMMAAVIGSFEQFEAAVKIRNHQVVEEWHSLVNPQRAIPAKITQITGITDEMVRGASIFAEVADSFMRFMDDGIFVAHNANYDYGFISYEYERLDRRFRFPKLCTVA